MMAKMEKGDLDGQMEESRGWYGRITKDELFKHIAYENKRRKLFKIWVWRGRKGRPPK